MPQFKKTLVVDAKAMTLGEYKKLRGNARMHGRSPDEVGYLYSPAKYMEVWKAKDEFEAEFELV